MRLGFCPPCVGTQQDQRAMPRTTLLFSESEVPESPPRSARDKSPANINSPDSAHTAFYPIVSEEKRYLEEQRYLEHVKRLNLPPLSTV
jgi:hypothetical protein